jgi:hypothetical protein
MGAIVAQTNLWWVSQSLNRTYMVSASILYSHSLSQNGNVNATSALNFPGATIQVYDSVHVILAGNQYWAYTGNSN